MTWVRREAERRRERQDRKESEQAFESAQNRLIAARSKYFWQTLTALLRHCVEEYCEVGSDVAILRELNSRELIVEKTTHPPASVIVTLNVEALSVEYVHRRSGGLQDTEASGKQFLSLDDQGEVFTGRSIEDLTEVLLLPVLFWSGTSRP